MPAATVPVPVARVHSHTLSNGLTLVAQDMPDVGSAAFSFLLPSGSGADPLGQGGSANLLSEWVVRGAGTRDKRELSDHLDNLGLHRGQSAGREVSTLDGVLLAPQLDAALDAYADILRRPRLDAAEFEETRAVALQELEAMEDQPAAKWSRELAWRIWPFPLSRPVEGTRPEIEKLTPEGLAVRFRAAYCPQGAVLAVAGKVDWPRLRERVEGLFGDWRGAPPPPPAGPDCRARVSRLVEPIEQMHLGVAFPSVPFGDPDYYLVLIAVRILSGGMGARLFTEVREKRGLCYSVHAWHATLRGCGMVVAYADPEPPKAAETIDVLLAELRKLAHGVEPAELARAKTGVKSRLVMSAESTRARVGSIASDLFYLGRVRSMEEILAAVEGITLERINAFLAANPPGKFTLVTLGAVEAPVPDLE